MRGKSANVCLGILVLSIVPLLLTCSDTMNPSGEYTDHRISVRPPTPTERRMWEEETSPDELLADLVVSYEAESISAYEPLLNELFLFHFEPAIAESLGMPPDRPWWGRTEDLNSTSTMFAHPHVTVEMELSRISAWHACTDSVSGMAALCCLAEPDIRVTISEPGQDPMVLRANDSVLEVVLVEEQDRPGIWTILAIKERLKDPGGSPSNTWSGIKGLFR